MTDHGPESSVGRMEDKDDPEALSLMLTVDVEVNDPEALRAYAVTMAQSPEEITMADSSSIDALLLAAGATDFPGPIPGVTEQHSRTNAYPGHFLDYIDTVDPDQSENQFKETRIKQMPRVVFLEQSVEGMLAAAKQVRGLREEMHEAAGRMANLTSFLMRQGGSEPEDIPPLSPQQVEIIAGVLWHASVTLIGGLFDDLESLRGGRKTVKDMGGKSNALYGLPEIYDDRYDREFTESFLALCHDLSMMLVTGWRKPSCPAQDLAVSCLQDHAEAHVKDTPIEAALPWYWPDILTEMMPEGGDVTILAGMTQEEFDREQFPGDSPVRFENWFKPYGPEDRLPPYVKYWHDAEPTGEA